VELNPVIDAPITLLCPVSLRNHLGIHSNIYFFCLAAFGRFSGDSLHRIFFSDHFARMQTTPLRQAQLRLELDYMHDALAP
jgi:hypothetical protein